jgi:hypothetical protein
MGNRKNWHKVADYLEWAGVVIIVAAILFLSVRDGLQPLA